MRASVVAAMRPCIATPALTTMAFPGMCSPPCVDHSCPVKNLGSAIMTVDVCAHARVWVQVLPFSWHGSFIPGPHFAVLGVSGSRPPVEGSVVEPRYIQRDCFCQHSVNHSWQPWSVIAADAVQSCVCLWGCCASACVAASTAAMCLPLGSL